MKTQLLSSLIKCTSLMGCDIKRERVGSVKAYGGTT
jgi:hypothetical protein